MLQTTSDSLSLKDKSLAKTATKKEDHLDLLFLGERLA
ncbi:hypothetical protein HMPREF1115_1024 [Streptococcus oralis SK610]|uniref:Uncharacterized protein n=1 Tax=Streptococcus oralis SK610 TaxID=1095741 RepID=I0Q0I8_STROR|nr:hypothetical protein HMPREF1115_1024 [Streptococcus oralis SK610]